MRLYIWRNFSSKKKYQLKPKEMLLFFFIKFYYLILYIDDL